MASEEITVDRKLTEIFEEGYKLYDKFDTRQDSTNSDEFQVGRDLAVSASKPSY